MAVYKFSDDRRNDPEVRAKVERLLLAQNAALLEAKQTLDRLSNTMRHLSIGVNPIYDRCVAAVQSARWTVTGDADFMNRNGGPNDCYLGNMAAGEMGDFIERIDFEARFGGKA